MRIPSRATDVRSRGSSSRQLWAPPERHHLHLKHPAAQKASHLNMENHQVALKVASLACPLLNSYFSFPWEIKAIVSTLGPNPSDLKQTAYAIWWLRLGTARNDLGV